MRLALLASLLASATAHAGLAVRVQPMTAAADDVCALLKADKYDRCKRVVKDGDAIAYQAGTHDLRRFVLAIARPGDDTLVGASVDLHGDDDVSLVSALPAVRPLRLDGRPAILLDVVATYRARSRDTWQAESFIGCGQAADGAWRCSSLDLGRCSATVDDDGLVTTSCGEHARLTLKPGN